MAELSTAADYPPIPFIEFLALVGGNMHVDIDHRPPIDETTVDDIQETQAAELEESEAEDGRGMSSATASPQQLCDLSRRICERQRICNCTCSHSSA